MRLALAQINPTVGDIAGNAELLRRVYADALDTGADLVAAGELALTGYPPEDLVLKPAFLDATARALEELAGETGPVPLVVGFVEHLPRNAAGADVAVADAQDDQDWRPVASEATEYPPLANAAAVCRDGRVEAVYRKQRLPNYGVFDEARYFYAGRAPVVVEVAGTPVGLTICEDLWGKGGPVEQAAAEGAQLVLNINGSPYHRDKRAEREHWARHHARGAGVWLAWVNLVGGQDEIVFDGDSLVCGPHGDVTARGAQFSEELLLADVPLGVRSDGTGAEAAPRLEPVAEVYSALVRGTGDYCRKNGFETAVVGLSGGIDSALVGVVAADALGAANVTTVAMPSRYSSPGSVTDAKALATNVGTVYLELGISEVFDGFLRTLTEPFAGTEEDIAEENIQSRIRGMLLMALSNKFGGIVLATGNKSESAVGYSTLYGDMAGGFAPIKDVPKTLVYELCRYRNSVDDTPAIPQSVLDKPPSAELRPDQRDTDSLPDYAILDPILEAYVEHDLSIDQIEDLGYDRETVVKVIRLVDRAEYKRRQAAPGVKISARAFGKDRRLPITQRWSGQATGSSDPSARGLHQV